MISYTKRNINAISLIISIPIIITILILLNQNKIKNTSILQILNNNIIEIEMKSESIKKETKEQSKNNNNEKSPNNEINQNNQNELNSKNNQNESNLKYNQNNLNQTKDQNNQNWILEIPKINLKAPISEGTTKEILDNYIGHFEKTSKNTGNIALAAHNRGYKVNYFQNIKKLKKDDEIIYKYQNTKRTYKVTENIIIKDTDWSYLENTKENTITLITCVEDEPNFRRCIYGIESIE